MFAILKLLMLTWYKKMLIFETLIEIKCETVNVNKKILNECLEQIN